MSVTLGRDRDSNVRLGFPRYCRTVRIHAQAAPHGVSTMSMTTTGWRSCDMDGLLWARTVLRSADAVPGARRDLVRYLAAWGRREATTSVLALALPLVEPAAAAGDEVELRFWNLGGGVRVEIGAHSAGMGWPPAAEQLETWRQRLGGELASHRYGTSSDDTLDYVWFEVDASMWAAPHRTPSSKRLPGVASA